MGRRHDVAQYGEGGPSPYDRLQISPAWREVGLEGDVQISATARDRSDNLVDVTELVVWQTDDPLVATIGEHGLLHPLVEGEIIVYARLGALFARATVVIIGGTVYIITDVKTSNYAASDNDLVRANPIGGSFTVTLPLAALSYSVIIKNQSDSPLLITISRAGSDTIDGQTAFALEEPRGSITLFSDGVSDWMVT